MLLLKNQGLSRTGWFGSSMWDGQKCCCHDSHPTKGIFLSLEMSHFRGDFSSPNKVIFLSLCGNIRAGIPAEVLRFMRDGCLEWALNGDAFS